MIKLILGKHITFENCTKSGRKADEVAILFVPSMSIIANPTLSHYLGFLQPFEIISGLYASFFFSRDYLLFKISQL